jgi:endoglucanase
MDSRIHWKLPSLQCGDVPDYRSCEQHWYAYRPFHLHHANSNAAFDIHEYLDVDFSGGHALCSSLASTYLAPLTSWLQEYGFKAMITEFGAANGTECDTYVVDIINYMAENPVYIGWTAWAAGPLWGSSSPCCSDGALWGSFEPDSLASDGSPGFYETVWLKEIEPLLPSGLQRSGISNVNGPGGVVGSSSSSSHKATSTISKSSSSTSKKTSTTSKSSSSISKTSTTSSSKAATSTVTVVGKWGQCGGNGYTGSTICASGSTCTYSNPYYSQCL